MAAQVPVSETMDSHLYSEALYKEHKHNLTKVCVRKINIGPTSIRRSESFADLTEHNLQEIKGIGQYVSGRAVP
jgi:hypothetical protein